jgi:hypothetical protein
MGSIQAVIRIFINLVGEVSEIVLFPGLLTSLQQYKVHCPLVLKPCTDDQVIPYGGLQLRLCQNYLESYPDFTNSSNRAAQILKNIFFCIIVKEAR